MNSAFPQIDIDLYASGNVQTPEPEFILHLRLITGERKARLKGQLWSLEVGSLSFLIGVRDIDYGSQIQQTFHTASSPHMILLPPEGGA